MAKWNTLSTFHQVYIYRSIDSSREMNYNDHAMTWGKNHPDSFPHSSFLAPFFQLPLAQTSKLQVLLHFLTISLHFTARKVEIAPSVLNIGEMILLELCRPPFFHLTHWIMTLSQVQKVHGYSLHILWFGG